MKRLRFFINRDEEQDDWETDEEDEANGSEEFYEMNEVDITDDETEMMRHFHF